MYGIRQLGITIEKKAHFLAKKLLSENIFFGYGEGIAQAVSDLCSYRFAPLHIGHLVGDAV